MTGQRFLIVGDHPHAGKVAEFVRAQFCRVIKRRGLLLRVDDDFFLVFEADNLKRLPKKRKAKHGNWRARA